MNKKLLALAIALMFAMPLATYANEDAGDTGPGSEIRAEIEALKVLKTELRAKVEAGTLTKEEAKKAWHDAIAEVRAKKHALFSEKLDNAKEKYAKLAENNPELAAKIQARFEAMKAARQAKMAEYKALNDSYKNGDITKEEFKGAMMETRQEWKTDHEERKTEWKNWRRDRNEGRNGDKDEDTDEGDDE